MECIYISTEVSFSKSEPNVHLKHVFVQQFGVMSTEWKLNT